jgi:hypothetical protein
MQRGLNHDEHQFIASGRLIANGLLPYRDFPYFHAPTLSLVYALLFQWFPPLLLSARLFAVLCGWLGVLIVFGFAIDLTKPQAPPWRFLLAASAALLLMATPMFVYSSGRTWNHDLAMLLVLCALHIHQRSAWSTPETAQTTNRRYLLAVASSAFLLALAASVRLSFAFLAPAFLLENWWTLEQTTLVTPQKRQWQVRLLLAFTVGGLLGFAPALFCFWQAPAAFLFGNLEYVRLNTLYYRQHPEINQSMTLLSKLRYLGGLLGQPGNLLLVLAFLGTLGGYFKGERQGNPPLRLRFLLLLLACALLSALAATPSQVQYYYLLFPLLAVSVVVALAGWRPDRQRQGILGLSGLALVAALLAVPSYAPGLAILTQPAAWYPWKVHQRAQQLATLVDQGKVLTLAPLYPLEGGLPIYPTLATGSFAWRVAGLVDPARRTQLGLLDQAGLTQLWQSDPPRALLVGGEADDREAEQPLITLAQAQGYVPVEVLDKNTLWLSPLATWGNAIHLGAQTLPRTAVAPGQTVQATFYLQNRAVLSQNLNELVRFVGADGQELLRSEGWPWGSATSTWREGAVWPDGHTFTIPTNAQPGVYRIEVSFYDPATLNSLGDVVTVEYIVVARTHEEVNTLPIVAEFGNQIALRQTTVLSATLEPGDSLTARWVWAAQVRPSDDYTIFAHLVGPDGQPVAQQDQPPLNGFFPTRFWRPGYPIHDTLTMPIPPSTPPGDYQLVIGFYTPATLARLPITRNGAALGDSLTVATVHILAVAKR